MLLRFLQTFGMLLFGGVSLFFLAACNPTSDGGSDARAGEAVVDLNKKDSRRLLSYYVGGMVAKRARDPFEAGYLRENGGKYFLKVDSLSAVAPSIASDLFSAAGDGKIDWKEFEAIILNNYYEYRALPKTVETLMSETGDWTSDSTWFSFGVNGVMSPHRRQIYVRYSVLFEAISAYRKNGEKLLYPVGTTFVSEHLDGDRRAEVSAMRKRDDGFWDFFAYDANGALAKTLARNPTNLDVPTKCIGCHFGTRLFEPEKSYPIQPRPGPDGIRAIYFDYVAPSSDVIATLDEHRRRSDLILGLYGTLLIGRMKAMQADGSLSAKGTELLGTLGF